MLRIIKYFVYPLLLTLMLTGCISKVKSISIDKDLSLSENEGYLLIGVNTNQTLTELRISGEKTLSLSSADLGFGSNYILINVPAGEYEISKVFFGWRYYTFDDDKLTWSFDVKPNVISYVGDLEIKARGWGNSARFELVNKSSFALEYLEKYFKNILSSRRIQYWGPGNDRFFETVTDASQQQTVSEQELNASNVGNEND